MCVCIQCLCTCLHDLQLKFDQCELFKADTNASALDWMCWQCCFLVVNLVIFILLKGCFWLHPNTLELNGFHLWCSQQWKIAFKKIISNILLLSMLFWIILFLVESSYGENCLQQMLWTMWSKGVFKMQKKQITEVAQLYKKSTEGMLICSRLHHLGYCKDTSMWVENASTLGWKLTSSHGCMTPLHKCTEKRKKIESGVNVWIH